MRFENAPGKNVKKMSFENVKKCEKCEKCEKCGKNAEKWEQKAIDQFLFLSSIFHFSF